MNRLESIKERLKNEEYIKRDIEFYDAHEAVEYLIQEVESLQYKYDKYRETALNRIRFDEDRMNVLLQRLEKYEAALQHIITAQDYDDYWPANIAKEALKE